MNGLVSGYGSASDEEETTPVTSQQKISSANEWLECMDNTTGYPYYWNKNTNEVKWDRPAEMPSQPKIDKPAPNKESKSHDKKPQKKKSRSKSPPQVFIGPTLPQLTPEEIARQKVIKFEETMAKEIEKDVLKEAPPDWKQVKPQKGLYSKPFAWKKTNTCLETFKQMESTLKKASQSISSIAGLYGDDNDDEDEKSPPKTKSKRTGVHVKVQKPPSKQSKPLLKDIPGIFKEETENNDEDVVEDNVGDADQNTSEDPPKKKRRWDMKDRTYINSTAEKICQKLEFLEVAKIPVSPLKLLAVQVETLFVAWQNGALSNTYLQTTLEKFAIKMADIEQNTLAPPGWRVRWNRSMKKYSYENLITREVQFEPPSKSLTDDEDEDDDVNEVINVKESQNQKDSSNAEKLPPLPPPPPKDLEQPPLPPPPPEMSNPAPPPPEPQNQVEDMDLSDEESESIIETTQNNGNNQDHLKDVLSSFYSDLATMDPGAPGAGSKDTTPNHTPPQVNSPGPSFVQDQESSSQQSTLSDDRSNSPSAFGATGDSTDEKRKRKTKISSGLSMKKKNVGLLVTKWQNIQQEVKRNK